MKSRFQHAAALFLALAVGAGAAELAVGPGQALTSIAAALAAAAPGDTIVVHDGIYRETGLVVDKPVVLEGRGRPRIDGGGEGELLTVTASGVTVRGFELAHGGTASLRDLAGIRIQGADHVVVADNRILGCNFGIYLMRARDCAVRDNEVLGTPAGVLENGNGIHAWSCERLEFSRNRVNRHRDGIYLEFVTDSQIEGNTVASCLRYGLHFMSAHRNTYRRNEFTENGAGVAVMYSRGVTMEGNRFTRSWGAAAYGLLLKDLTDSKITDNVFEGNTIGVTIQSSTRMVLERNQFTSNGWALQVQTSSTDNRYRSNNFVGNAFDLTSNGDLDLNEFEGNYWDKAELFDLDRDGVGDVPYRPLSLFAKLVDRVPAALLLLRSPLVHFLDRAERVFPTLTPDALRDPHPAMRPLAL